ncbi:shikimate dehydrogenase [Limibacter armeniacum]|uniref:shikimate dehydrogenase family protein n=1 Tax=Limibacter armeniacum TaxID=466084 RepID=UPI002FE5F244
MNKLGLIGFPLKHSFSQKYFSEKFEKENIEGYEYHLYELPSISELPKLLKEEEGLLGLNVTIPYKEQVIPFLDKLDPETAGKIGAVNVIKVEEDGTLTGYNSDYFGFANSLKRFVSKDVKKALVLGTGGAAKAVKAVLESMTIEFVSVSRTRREGVIAYENLTEEVMASTHLIVNTTPLGTFPDVENAPDIPYHYLTASHYCYDLVYNPSETAFMKKAAAFGAHIKNGMEMLQGQAEAAWSIWQMQD